MMADKMMRVAGRSNDGKAKAILASGKGELVTTFSEDLLMERPNNVMVDFSKKVQGDDTGIVVRTSRNINRYDKPFRGGSELTTSSYSKLGNDTQNITLSNNDNTDRYLHYFVEINLEKYLKHENKIPKALTLSELNNRIKTLIINIRSGGIDRVARYSLDESEDYIDFGQSNSSLVDEINITLENPLLMSEILFLNLRSIDDKTTGRGLTLEHLSIDVEYTSFYLPTGAEATNGTTFFIDAETKRNTTEGLSVEKDPENLNVLRVIDAAPFAYEKNSDRLRVTTSKKVEKAVITEGINIDDGNAESVFVMPNTNTNAILKFFTVYLPKNESTEGTFEFRYQVGNISGHLHEYIFVDENDSSKDYRFNSNNKEHIHIFKDLVFSDTHPLTIRIINKSGNVLDENVRLTALYVEEER